MNISTKQLIVSSMINIVHRWSVLIIKFYILLMQFKESKFQLNSTYMNLLSLTEGERLLRQLINSVAIFHAYRNDISLSLSPSLPF